MDSIRVRRFMEIEERPKGSRMMRTVLVRAIQFNIFPPLAYRITPAAIDTFVLGGIPRLNSARSAPNESFQPADPAV